MAARLAAVAVALVALALAAPAAAAPRLAEIGRFSGPVHAASPPGDARIFVVEQRGTVRVLDAAGTILPEPFLDVGGELASGAERGLLSIAFAPDYATSGLFYVYLTAAAPTGQIQVREYRRSALDANRADPIPVRTVLAQDHPRSNHNGGSMLFGPDGKLWLGLGDGGGANDPDANGQDRAEWLGKILRLDPRGGGLPNDNPFLAPADGARDEIWAYGLRNPWRFSFDRQTGDLIIGDVGQDAREEIDFAPASQARLPGANYGWRCYEGSLRTPGVVPCEPPGHVLPVHELTHGTDGVCSITGGHVVRDPGLPTLAGRYVYGDICLSRLRSVVLTASGSSGDRPEPDLPVGQVSSFAEDACGRLLVVDLDGAVSRLVDGAPSPCNFTAPGADGGGPPGPGSAGRDGCGLVIKAPRARTHRTVTTVGLRVAVQASSRCRVDASARITDVGTLTVSSRTLVAGERVLLRLKASRAVKRALARHLRRRRSVSARVTVVAEAEGFPPRSKRATTRIVR